MLPGTSPVLCNARLYENDDGEVEGICATARDISDRIKAEIAVAAERQKFIAILDILPPYIVLLTPDYRVAFANREFRRRFGESHGRRCYEFLFERSEPCENCETYKVLRTREPRRWEWTGPDQRYYDVYDFPFVDTDGSTLILEMGIDTTEQTQAEKALRQSTAELQEAQRVARLGSWSLDVETGYIRWSDELFRMFGLPPGQTAPTYSELSGMLAPGSFGRMDVAIRETTRTGLPYELELEMVRSDRTNGWMLARGEAVRNADGVVNRVRGVALDITERKLMETRLQQAQKMEAVGRLAGGIAHDFNNILAIITGYTDLVLEDASLGDESHRCLLEIKKSANRAVEVTRQLLAFSRKQVFQTRILDLNTCVRDTAKMLGRLLGEDIDVVTSFATDLGMIEADPTGIDQILMNFAVNARDAMPNGGKLFIETANATTETAYGETHANMPAGEWVLLSVTDTGCGMDAETRKHIFEPFFTTKEKGRGTGLGLSTVYGVVKQSNGYVWVYSEVGVGTTFKVYLPRVRQPASTPVPRPPKVAPSGTETVLLVEDDVGLLRLNRALLCDLGYKVLEASNAPEALQVAATCGEEIHLLMTDVIMPGMNGYQLAERLIQLMPELRVLFVSGHADTVLGRQVADARAAFLQKPFDKHVLACKVREVLAMPTKATTKVPAGHSSQ